MQADRRPKSQQNWGKSIINKLGFFRPQEKKSPSIDPLEISTDQERRKVFLRYVNRAWLAFGIITLVSLPIFPEHNAEFIFLISVIFPTYLITRFLNLSSRTWVAGVIFTLSVNFGFYGLFMMHVRELGAYKAFETETTIWMLMGLAVLFAGAFVDKRAAPVIAALNSILLIGTRLTLAPNADPRPSALVFWWMVALTVWLYESTLHEAFRRSWIEVMERKQTNSAIQEVETKYRVLVERLPVAVYTSELGVNGVWHYISPQIEQLLGFTSDEWLTDSGLWYRQVHPDDRDRQEKLEEQAWAQKEPFESEYRIFTRDGRLIWIRDSAHILPPQDNGAPIVQGVLMDITERKQTEEALNLSKAQLLANLNNTPNVAIQWFDRDGKILYWNPASESMYGWNSTDALGKTLGQLIHTPEEQTEFMRILAEVQETGKPFGPYESRIHRRDGASAWVLATTFSIPMYGDQMGFVCMDVDITERKLTEEELKQSEDRYRNLFNTMEEGVAINEVIFDEHGNAVDYIILDINPAFERHSPYKFKQAFGKRATDLYQMSHEFIREWWNEHKQKKQAVQTEYYHEPSGRWFFITTTVPEQGRFATIFLNITERKLAENALAASETELRALFNSMQDVVLVIDRDGVYRKIAPTNPDLLYKPSQEMLGKNLWDIFSGGQADIFNSTIQHVLDTRQTARIEYALPIEDHLTWFSTSISPMDENNTLWVARDITERKQAEEEVNQRLTEQSILHHASQSLLTVHLDLEMIYTTLHQAVAQIMPCDAFTIVLDDENGGDYHAVYLYDTNQRYPPQRIPREQGLSEKVISNGETLFIHDNLQSNAPVVHFGSSRSVRSILAVPLRKNNKSVGMVSAQSYHPNVYSERHSVLLETLTAQITTVIENARLFGETARRAQEFISLYETSNTLSTEHDLNTLLRFIVENAKNLLNTSTSGMYLTVPGSDELELSMATSPYIPLGMHIHLGEGAAGRVAQTRQPLRVDDYSTWAGRSPLYEGAPIRAVVEVPMLYKGELIGVLTADEAGESERKFTEEDERLLSLFASQAAGAIHSARLRQETINRLRELELLYESGLILSQLVSPQAIAQEIINLLDQKMDWHHTTIRLYHPQDETMELLAFNKPGLNSEAEQNAVEELFRMAVTRPGQGLSGWVVQHDEVVRSNDIKNDPRYVDTYPGLRSGLYVPIKIAERVIGVISIESEKADAFSESDERLTVTLATQAAFAIHNAQLFDELELSNADLILAYDATIEGWSRAMDLRDHETEGHTLRVTDLTLKLARGMHLSPFQLIHIRRGSLLHDIGKMGVPDAILLKEGKLTDEEWVIMRKHPQFAYEMLSAIHYLREALDIPSNHHEKWDGTGYPRGLKGEQIPLAARIFAVVDVWDAIRSDRPYRKGWSAEKAIDYIKSQSGTHFDPNVVDAFLKLMDETNDPNTQS